MKTINEIIKETLSKTKFSPIAKTFSENETVTFKIKKVFSIEYKEKTHYVTLNLETVIDLKNVRKAIEEKRLEYSVSKYYIEYEDKFRKNGGIKDLKDIFPDFDPIDLEYEIMHQDFAEELFYKSFESLEKLINEKSIFGEAIRFLIDKEEAPFYI